MTKLELLLPMLEEYETLGAKIEGSLKQQYFTLSLPDSGDSMTQEQALDIQAKIKAAVKQIAGVFCYSSDCYRMLIYVI